MFGKNRSPKSNEIGDRLDGLLRDLRQIKWMMGTSAVLIWLVVLETAGLFD